MFPSSVGWGPERNRPARGSFIRSMRRTCTALLIALAASSAPALAAAEPLPFLWVKERTVIERDSGVRRTWIPVSVDASPRPVTVSYRTVKDTARPGRDYRSTTGRLRFDPYQTRRSIPVEILGDLKDEREFEWFWIELFDPTGARVTYPTRVLIQDNEQAVVDLESKSVVEGSASQTVTMSLRRYGPAERRARFAIRSGRYPWPTGQTAVPGWDYEPVLAVVAMAPGVRVATFEVTVLGDDLGERDEDIAFDVLAMDDARMRTVGMLTIQNDDGERPALNPIGLIRYPSGLAEGLVYPNQVAGFEVWLDEPAAEPIEVRYQTEDETAAGGLDYRPRTGTYSTDPYGGTQEDLVVFEPGEQMKTIGVYTSERPCPVLEGRIRTFLLHLVLPSNASVGLGTQQVQMATYC